jgi:hypothetical protein
MTNQDYVGKQFIAKVMETDGAFGGILEVDPNGNPLASGQEVTFIVGSNKKGLEYTKGLRSGERVIEVRSADPITGDLFVKPYQRPLNIIRKDIDDLTTKVKKARSTDHFDFWATLLEVELDNYLPNQDSDTQVLLKYAKLLGEKRVEGHKRLESRLAEQSLLEKFRTQMRVEQGSEKYADAMAEMAMSFLKRTTKKHFAFSQAREDFRRRLSQTLVGVVENKLVAMLSYFPKPIDEVFKSNYIDNLGVINLNPELGKIFLSGAVPLLPHKRGYVLLWEAADFSFFEEMGFEKGNYTYVIKRNERGKANVHQAYNFVG